MENSITAREIAILSTSYIIGEDQISTIIDMVDKVSIKDLEDFEDCNYLLYALGNSLMIVNVLQIFEFSHILQVQLLWHNIKLTFSERLFRLVRHAIYNKENNSLNFNTLC
jgi:hypothetical protein